MPINNITQTISTLPPAGRRGVDVQTQFVIKQEDFQDHLQGTTVTELNTLKDQLNLRIGEINTTTTTINGYADTASAAATTATTKAGEASTSASNASTSKNQASTFATNSANSATKASQWADNNYNVAVETGRYSAKHWATVAQNTLNNKVDKVTSTDNALVRFNGTTGEVQNSTATVSDVGKFDTTSSGDMDWGVSFNKTGYTGSGTAHTVYGCYTHNGNNNTIGLYITGGNGLSTGTDFEVGGKFKIDGAGLITALPTYSNTTASAANMFIDSAGKFFRSTSSKKYKTDIENIDKSYVDTFLDNARPIYYKSRSDNDNSSWGYWGFIAEEIAEFDKRLVHWRFDTKEVEVQKERVLEDETIEKYIETEVVNDETKPMIAEGVMYERITVLLTAKLQEQQKLINTLINRIDILEGAI